MASGQSTIPSSERSCWKPSPMYWESAGRQPTTMPGRKPTRQSARSCWRGPACRPQSKQAMYDSQLSPAHSAVKGRKLMSESVRERTCNLDGIAAKLYKNEDVAETMGLLFSELQERRDHLSPESWKQLTTMNCRQHPLLELLHQDPLSSRVFLKPRAYAAKAEVIHLIYVTASGAASQTLQR